MDFLPSNWGTEFVAGGVGGTVGVLAGHPFDTLRIRQQHARTGSAFGILRHVVAREGPSTLFRGMLAPLASISFQNAVVFQTYAGLSRAFDRDAAADDPTSYKSVALAGISAGAVQSLLISPVELVKIRLQLQTKPRNNITPSSGHKGLVDVARNIIRAEGLRGIFRGLGITVLRDAPSHGVYFWTYEYMKEQLRPGCHKTGQESFRTMLLAGGLAGAASWVFCYPLDVIKTRIQAQSGSSSLVKYSGIVDCFRRSIKQEGYGMLWRGLGTTVARAFIVNGAVFTAYETALSCLRNNNHAAMQTANAF